MRAYLRLEWLSRRSNHGWRADSRRGSLQRPAGSADAAPSFLAPIWGRVLSLVVLALMLLSTAATEGTRPQPLREAAVASLALGLAVGWILPTLRDSPFLHRLGYVLMTAGGTGLTVLGHAEVGAITITAVVIMTSVVYELYWSAGLATFATALYDLLTLWRFGPQSVTMFTTLLWCYVFIVGRVLRSARIAQWQAERVLSESAEAAVLRERARIARDIHDVLGHSLSALAVQLETARVLLPQRQENQESIHQIQQAAKVARQSLAELGEAVGTLRGDPLPGLARIGDLASRFQQDTGIVCHVHIQPAQADVSPEVQMAIYRCIQESLTNARKHSRPNTIWVDIDYDDSDIHVNVVNDGAPASGAPPMTAGGYGLDGMRERAELLGGSLTARLNDERFEVHLRLPR
jgi:signal transduction histidine kinase